MTPCGNRAPSPHGPRLSDLPARTVGPFQRPSTLELSPDRQRRISFMPRSAMATLVRTPWCLKCCFDGPVPLQKPFEKVTRLRYGAFLRNALKQ